MTETLQALKRDGLVESRPRVSARVCLPGAEDVRDRYPAREALESQAPMRPRHATHGKMADLDALFSRAGAKAGNHDIPYAVHRDHLEFHPRIAEVKDSRDIRSFTAAKIGF